MLNYVADYNVAEGCHFVFEMNATNLIWDNFFMYVASQRLGYTTLFFITAFVYFGGMWLACYKMFPNDSWFAFLVCLAAFSTFSYGTNGVKAGAAGSVFLLALAYRENRVVSILLALVSLGIHHSMQLPLTAFLLTLFYKKTKVYIRIWCVCLLLAMLNVTFFQEIFAGMTDEHGSSYLLSDEDWGGKKGFRLDFVLYSCVPVWVGYWVVFKKKIESQMYSAILNIYVICNSVWMLCMYASFTNRIAYLSWFMYPVVLIYPFLKEKLGEQQYRKLGYVAWGHLLFTLFMNVIYYR